MGIQAMIESNVLQQAELEGDRSAEARERKMNLEREYEELVNAFEKQVRKRQKSKDTDWDL